MWKFAVRVAKGIDRRMGMSLQRSYLYQIKSPNQQPTKIPANPDLNWELLGPDGIPGIVTLGAFDPSEAPERVVRGDKCYTDSIDGRLAHFSWVQASGTHKSLEAGIRTPVETGDFWIYHCFTAAWARGRQLYPSTLRRICSDYFAAGCSTAWIYTTRENIASQKGILSAGFVPVETFKAIRFGDRFY